jgi:hypothetical protein
VCAVELNVTAYHLYIKTLSDAQKCLYGNFTLPAKYKTHVGLHVPEGKRPMGRSRRSREDNIKMDLQEVGCGGWTGLSWLRIETVGEHL